MASTIFKLPIYRLAHIRGFSTKAVGIPVGGCKDYNISVITLQNQLIVASAENNSSLARVSVVFKAGSRYESCNNLGAAHVVRIAAGLSTLNSSQFAITRNLQQLGANLTCSTDREVIAYTLEATQETIEGALPFLADVCAQQCFKPWEVSDNLHRLRLELKSRTPQVRVVDLLHKAAFRSQGLGNSLFIMKGQIGKISSETLQHYAANTIAANRGAVIGLGVQKHILHEFAESLQLGCSSLKDECNSYIGGEVRYERAIERAYVAVAGEGAALNNQTEVLAFGVLQHALGGTPSIKYARGNQGGLSKANACSDSIGVSALNISYSDAGLFGALISAPTIDIAFVFENVVKTLKEGRVTNEDIERGKTQLKANALLALECGTTAIQEIGTQALFTREASDSEAIISAIDNISSTDVVAAAKKVAGSKLSIAGYGGLHNVPYLDELK